MDKCTHEVRKQHWMNIISQCMQRSEGMTVKQWCDENGICEQTYYVWLKKIRQEAYSLATAPKTIPTTVTSDEITFAEVKIPTHSNKVIDDPFRPDMTIRKGSTVIGISNSISDSLLAKVLEVIVHA